MLPTVAKHPLQQLPTPARAERAMVNFINLSCPIVAKLCLFRGNFRAGG